MVYYGFDMAGDRDLVLIFQDHKKGTDLFIDPRFLAALLREKNKSVPFYRRIIWHRRDSSGRIDFQK